MNPEMRHHRRRHVWDPASAGLFIAGAAICASTIGVFAQAAPAQRPAQAPATQRPAAPSGTGSTQRFTVIGCVAREAQSGTAAGRGAAARYTITDRRGDRPTAYRLQGDAKELDLHVGHTMEVSGTLAPSAAAGRGGEALVVNVSSMIWVSTTCQK
jgi:hypothetical protein